MTATVVLVPGPPSPTPAAQLGTGVRDHCANKVVLLLTVIEDPARNEVPPVPVAFVYQPLNSKP